VHVIVKRAKAQKTIQRGFGVYRNPATLSVSCGGAAATGSGQPCGVELGFWVSVRGGEGGFIWWALRGRGGRVSRRIRRGGWADHAQVGAVFVLVPSDGMTSGPRSSVAGERGARTGSGEKENRPWAGSWRGLECCPAAFSSFSFFPHRFLFCFSFVIFAKHSKMVLNNF
jgi:hypothetical protein